MTKRYPAGSEWRKWDLHVHLPGTRLSDSYQKKDGLDDWDRFADALENSDVAVLGITDYFSASQSLAFIRHFKDRHPRSEKLLLVNVELRLNETVNRDQQLVDFHVVFRDTVTEAKIQEFLSKLTTQITDANARMKPCSELSGNDYNSATITRAGVRKAFAETFGQKAEPTDFLIYIAPANNNGLRAQQGRQRKANLADEIDKEVHAIFGKDIENSKYFLRTDRYEDKEQPSKPKPVFGGCDAHSFTDLANWLGKTVTQQGARQVTTWIKADPTFEGLQQTLVEPADRVRLTALKPDAKEDYKVIKRVTFEGSTDFPATIAFSPNLNAIIGSRSAGKSALLAHISHAVDPDNTVDQQAFATKLEAREIGPAAGHSWKSVESTVCNVEWADGSTGGGQVIYIPQNWLFQIGSSAKAVTARIQPVLESRHSKYFREHQRQLELTKTINSKIEEAVARWFELAEEAARLEADMKQVGDKASVTKARDEITDQIEELRAENSLSAEELKEYRDIIGNVGASRDRLDEIAIEAEVLTSLVSEATPKQFIATQGAVSAETRITPDPRGLPEPLANLINAIVDTSTSALIVEVESAIVAHRTALSHEVEKLTNTVATLESENQDLLNRHKANAALDELVTRQEAQQASLNKIDDLAARRDAIFARHAQLIQQIEEQTQAREAALKSLVTSFESEPRKLDQLTFGIEIDFDTAWVRMLSAPFRKSENGTFLMKDSQGDQIVDIARAQGAPAEFLQHLFTKKQKLNQGNDPTSVARQVLTASPEVRFTATLDQDRIGGFERSTMTPGKQALFALTLILGEAEEGWPLLIDQPEDDLDSRSIYGEVVQYLVAQKKQRQIILVTHNANLVVGADAEEVLVANRHGDDRKNKDDRTFDYLTGSLEHSTTVNAGPYDLDRMGIREHAVEILDGGEEAFQKRRDKYKIRRQL